VPSKVKGKAKATKVAMATPATSTPAKKGMKKAPKPRSSLSAALKHLRLPTRGLKDLDAHTRVVADVLKAALAAKGTSVDLTRVRLIKLHDTGTRIPRLIAMKSTALTGKKSAETVDRIYRVTWDAMDEFVRTSFVRNLIIGIGPGDLAKPQAKIFEDVVRTLSAFRMPTKMSGFNFNDGTQIGGYSTMQHPTSPGTGMWLKSTTGHGSAHNHLDAARITEIQDRVMAHFSQDAKTKVYSLKPGVSLQDLVNTMVVTGGTFTLGRFTMPATASNVTTDASVTAAEKEVQARIREYMKDQLELFGAKRSTAVRATTAPVTVPKLDLDLLKRPAAPELLNPGEISPRRTIKPVALTDISAHLGL